MAGRYVSWAEVVARYKSVAQDASTAELQEGWITGAEDHIDAALGMRYTVPFTDPPGIPGAVKDVAIDLVYYKMNVRQPDAKALKQFIDERIKGMQTGTLVLAVGGVGGFSHAQVSYHSAFGLDCPLNWQSDSDVADDAQGERE